MKQTNINDKLDKEKRAQACQYIGRLFYLASISFNVARLDEFKWAIEAIGQYGPNMKPPSYHKLRVPILKKEVAYTNELLSDHKKDWKKYGCSIMSDGWTSRTNRTLINFNIRAYYVTIKSIYKQKHNLRAMFTSEEWVRSRWAKEANAKRVVETILMPSFWNTIVYILKVMGPLVQVLCLVDNERKPAMGYIYEAMDRAKQAIIKAFNENEERYTNIFKIIDERWECQLHQPLHAVGYFLNPKYFYFDDNIATNHEITARLYACMQRLVPIAEIQDKIMAELPIYKKAEGLFGIELAKRSRKTRAPGKKAFISNV